MEQVIGAIALLAGRQWADVASSAVLVMRGLLSQLPSTFVGRRLHAGGTRSNSGRHVTMITHGFLEACECGIVHCWHLVSRRIPETRNRDSDQRITLHANSSSKLCMEGCPYRAACAEPHAS